MDIGVVGVRKLGTIMGIDQLERLGSECDNAAVAGGLELCLPVSLL